MSKCDVCGKETNTTVCCSSCGAVSFAYCDECLRTNREPYDALVGMGLHYDTFCKTYKDKVLLPSLQFFGKTVEQFNADIDKMDEDYRKWCEENKDKAGEEL